MKKILNALMSLLPEGMENVETPINEEAEFTIKFDKLVIGKLNLSDGKWFFEYSNEFKSQDEILPLVDFPDVNKVYESEELWPFFLVRIPSTQQPKVKKIIDKEHIDANNEVELLKRFGKKTISNPYELVY